MTTLNLQQGVLRLYYALWGVGATVTFFSSVYFSFFYHESTDPRYLGLWVVLAVIAPAVVLKLIVWVIKGFKTDK